MQTHEIGIIAQSIPIPGFLGVYAADQIPKHPSQKRFCFICNTDPASLPGTHWLAFNFIDPMHYEFFDSYGQALSSAYASLINASPLLSSSLCIAASKNAIQSLYSNLCGQYSLFFLYHRLCNHNSFKSFYSHHFSPNRKSNDSLVNSFSCNVLKYCYGRELCAQYNTTCTQSCHCFSK